MKKTTRKTASKKSPARKAPASKPVSRKAASRKTSPLDAAAREKTALVDRLEQLGLLDVREVEKLRDRVEALTGGTLGDGLGKAAAWDRNLGQALGAVSSETPGSPKKAHEALVAWHASLTGLTDDEAGLTTALESFRRVIPYAGATLYLRDPEAATVVPFVVSGFQVDLISRIRFTEGSGFSSWVALRKKPVLYSSLHRNEAPKEDQVRSFMAAPLVVGSECVGVLTLGHGEEEAYQPPTLRLLLLAAGLLAGPVQRFLARRQIAAREIHDPLTGLAASGYLASRLEEEVLRCRELGYSMSLLAFRLNELNEYAGRFGGDYRSRCLTELGEAVQEWRTPTELVGHWTGDRLVVLLPGAGADRARARAEALVELLERRSFPRRKRMTVSVGVAAYPADAEDAQALLAVADKGMRTQDMDGAGPGEVRSLLMVS